MLGLSLVRESGVARLMAQAEWINGITRDREVVFSETHLGFVVEAARAFLSSGSGANGEVLGDGDVLTTQVGGTDGAPGFIIQNTRHGESGGTVWLSEAQARALLSLVEAESVSSGA